MAGKVKETGTSNRHIGGESVARNPKGRSNYNEWRLTERQYKKMQNGLLDNDYFQGYADFIVKILSFFHLICSVASSVIEAVVKSAVKSTIYTVIKTAVKTTVKSTVETAVKSTI
jgi:hypothetical protein